MRLVTLPYEFGVSEIGRLNTSALLKDIIYTQREAARMRALEYVWLYRNHLFGPGLSIFRYVCERFQPDFSMSGDFPDSEVWESPLVSSRFFLVQGLKILGPPIVKSCTSEKFTQSDFIKTSTQLKASMRH